MIIKTREGPGKTVASICLIVALVSLALICWTFLRCYESYRAHRDFYVTFESLQYGDTQEEFVIDLHLYNEGDIPTLIETLNILFYCDEQLISSEIMHPKNMNILPGKKEVISLQMVSQRKMPLDLAQTGRECYLRVYTEMSHSTRRGTIHLWQECSLGEAE